MKALIFSLLLCVALPLSAAAENTALAQRILADDRLDTVLEQARVCVGSGFSAGDGYGEVWIRDLATFIRLACTVHPQEAIAERLEVFFLFQGEDGNIIDGYIPKEKASVGYDFIKSPACPAYLGHKNTVETDQESSLVHAVCAYVKETGDTAFYEKQIAGESVTTRLERALDYLMKHRYDPVHGLIWGATTADWGDVQPEHDWGVRLDEDSHRAIDIYDNAMFLVAIDDFLAIPGLAAERREKWTAVRKALAENTRKHLWDEKAQKFIPHLYLEGSPFPADFDENEIYYFGGTGIAMRARLLSREEVGASLAEMQRRVKAAGAASIGLTLYPPYPKGFFKNKSMALPYSYQNGGDWTWFGGRIVRELIRFGYIEEAYEALIPMLDRVIKNSGFYEWYSRENAPRGSGTYRGSAGVLADAIEGLQAWAKAQGEASLKP